MGKTVLIVDDDDDIRLLLRTYLRRLDYEVREAGNAWQALAAVQQPVDLIVLDLRMPFDVSGADLIQTLESLGRSTPVIVLSGWTQDLDRDSLPSFVRAVIDKPVRLEEFSATVDRALQNDLN
ncbi:MAG: response regulator [Gemmatimonadetes bacterium]|jgi:two-component system response regulator AtoC|nr:response regulator [Gemmatimonadota bacterium]MBT4609820.1 response regulator [Gemmatimonadota bacterium]MBT5058008.1 response regulator [Gemmatimonadota bacterium]MBT5141669.1 response regulator [Gemmatimonadota bacterium]MBT5590972.1 response regulator [Gemmatimonadota bacterium]